MDEKKFLAETEAYIDRSTELMKSFRAQSKTITQIAKALDEARLKGANIYIMGNGGSASTASHMANDINKAACMHMEKKFRVICLTDNVPAVLAWANDESYDAIFIEQLKGFLNKGDVVIGISGSGNSPNVLRAIEYANSKSNLTIGLTGIGGGKLKDMAKLPLVIEDNSMQRVEDFHLMVNHILTHVFKTMKA